MPAEAKKKRTCTLCGTEHFVGEPCPECEWSEENEERRAKGDIEREKIRERLRAPEKKGTKGGKGFWS